MNRVRASTTVSDGRVRRERGRRMFVTGAALGLVLLAACGSDGGTAADPTTPDPTTPAVVEPAAAPTSSAAATPATDAPAATEQPSTEPAPTEPPATEPTPTDAVGTTTIRGTAYTFNTPDPIVGATILVDELPGVSATTAADGSYEIVVPTGTRVTPYIVADGHHTIYTQTFTTDGTTLEGVNLQTPSDDIYTALSSLIEGFIGRSPFEDGCVVVTTVGDARMVGMPFAEFIDFHPHGVAGATVYGEPAMPDPIYFNEQVIPDTAQLTTSIDGGVLWPNVAPGAYTLHAEHPDASFTTVDVTCAPDRVVNANPVWGLHALP
jgi:hypothetical protein